MKSTYFTYCFKLNSDGYYTSNYYNHQLQDEDKDLEQLFPIVYSSLVLLGNDYVRYRNKKLCDDIVGYFDKYNNIIVRVLPNIYKFDIHPFYVPETFFNGKL